MGVWGAGLYAGDFAADLRGAVAAVARLPFDGDRLVELLRQAEPGAADDARDPDHTRFWLVVADQLSRRGIVSARARDTALSIIDDGRDLTTMAALGLEPAGLRARGKMLAELRKRLTETPAPAKSRNVLKRPQPLLFNVGEVIVFPTSRGACINPYFPSKEKITGGWRQDGWGAAVVVEIGRVFDFLAWYRPLRAPMAMSAKPDLGALAEWTNWTLQRPGTASRLHIQRMEIERIGVLSLDPVKLSILLPNEPSGRSAAISDISIANTLNLPVDGVQNSVFQPNRRTVTVKRLSDISLG